MFTGLVEATGRILAIEMRNTQARLRISIPFAAELTVGESVAVNGCCLTVTDLMIGAADFDILAQTLHVTALGKLTANSIVNLERAVRVGDRLGGHFVQGHVDAVGEVLAIQVVGQDHRLEVALPPGIHRLCIDKGSLCVDGISLTIAELAEGSAVFWITPHTWMHTHLHQIPVGWATNLEADMLAKHVAKLLAGAQR